MLDEMTNVDFLNAFSNVIEEYCNEMTRVSLEIMELLAVSLGVDQGRFRKFYESHDSIMLFNHYPTCQQPGLTLGLGPHCDPSSLTVLHQEDVAGLQVFTDGMWRTIRPCKTTFVVNIGDTLMVSICTTLPFNFYSNVSTSELLNQHCRQ